MYGLYYGVQETPVVDRVLDLEESSASQETVVSSLMLQLKGFQWPDIIMCP